MPRLEPERLLDDLDPEQREAVVAASGPVAILAGAGTGKTRVISRRAAYAIGTDVVPPDQVLLVTFTDKAAGEMVERLRSLGLPGVTARTFHAHALSQLRHFWPSPPRRRAAPPAARLEDPAPRPARAPAAGRTTGSRRPRTSPTRSSGRSRGGSARASTSARSPASRRAASRRSRSTCSSAPSRLRARQGPPGPDRLRRPPRRDRRLLEEDADAADTIRARKRWFSVDEYQDTNPLQQRLLELWLGDRQDLCVVGDVDQTIYTFTGASSDYLTTFADRHAGARVLDLTRNYRSTPQVLELANRLIAADGRSKRLSTDHDAGPRADDHEVRVRRGRGGRARRRDPRAGSPAAPRPPRSRCSSG